MVRDIYYGTADMMTQPNQLARPRRDLGRTAGTPLTWRPPRYWLFIHYLAKRPEDLPDSAPSAAGESDEDQQSKLQRVEAALFLSREGLSSRKLAKIAGLADATEARTLIRHLNQEWDQAGSSFRVEEIAGGYALLTRSAFAAWLRRLPHVPGEKRLSQTALETLAVVAYRQPVLRAEVEAIRGVGCSEALKQLMELELVRISGRSEDLGRPYLYGTTRRFLQMFGLRSIDRLPRKAWVNESSMILTSPEIVGTDSEAKESIVTESLVAATTLEEKLDESLTTSTIPEVTTQPAAAVDDDDDAYYDDDDSFDSDDDDDDDDDWDDDDEADDLDDDEDDSPEWKEVGDDDDGWDDDDSDEDSDDDDDDDWDDDDEDDDWD